MKNLITTCNYGIFTKSLRAFTLAETLIVIGIIGVVAALTLPNLNHATGDKEKVTKVKKIYSALTDAYGRAEAIYGPYNEWCSFNWTNEDLTKKACIEKIAKRITEFMKVSKVCGFSEGCFSAAPLINVKGSQGFDNYLSALQHDHHYMVMLTDGISLAFTSYEGMVRFRIDIDGPNKGKNQIGNDIFNFSMINWDSEYYFENQILPSYFSNNSSNSPNPSYWTTTSQTTLWVIENGNLDYLKCIDELNWETQTSCK